MLQLATLDFKWFSLARGYSTRHNMRPGKKDLRRLSGIKPDRGEIDNIIDFLSKESDYAAEKMAAADRNLLGLVVQ